MARLHYPQTDLDQVGHRADQRVHQQHDNLRQSPFITIYLQRHTLGRDYFEIYLLRVLRQRERVKCLNHKLVQLEDLGLHFDIDPVHRLGVVYEIVEAALEVAAWVYIFGLVCLLIAIFEQCFLFFLFLW